MDERPADLPASPPLPADPPTDVAPGTSPPPPPALTPRPELRFDGSFVGPILPPPPPGSSPAFRGPELPPVTEAVLAIPLGTRRLVSMALDLLTRSDSGLRSASFYIGLLMLMTVAPAITLIGLAWLTLGDSAFLWFEYPSPYVDPGPWVAWLYLAAIPAVFGYWVASVEATALATTVIGGRAEGRPLRLSESIAIVRRRFWRVLWASVITGIVTTVASLIVSSIVDAAIGSVYDIDFGLSLAVGLIAGAPFVYVTAGIVIGEVGVGTAIRRSFALVRARKALAVVVTLFGVLSQFLVVLGLGSGLDTVVRLATGAGLADTFPAALAVPVIAALVFALGTLVFLVEAIAAAPAVYAFAALTHYTRGLEIGRRAPLRTNHAWEPYITPGLAIGGAIALVALLAGIASLPT